eukprot:scaffold7417_cov417-Prasinococcus_capsulatus_cf.AAC.1
MAHIAELKEKSMWQRALVLVQQLRDVYPRIKVSRQRSIMNDAFETLAELLEAACAEEPPQEIEGSETLPKDTPDALCDEMLAIAELTLGNEAVDKRAVFTLSITEAIVRWRFPYVHALPGPAIHTATCIMRYSEETWADEILRGGLPGDWSFGTDLARGMILYNYLSRSEVYPSLRPQSGAEHRSCRTEPD